MSTPTPAAPAAPAAPSPSPAAPTTAPSVPAAPAAPATPPAVVPAPPTAPPAVPAPPGPPPATAPQGEPQDVSGLPQWAQDHIRALRTEAADYRTRAQGTAPQPAAEPAAPQAPAPAAEGDLTRLPQWAQRAVTDGQGAARQLALRDAVMSTAEAAGANLRAVIDSTSTMAALAAVDPADTAAVTAALTAAVQANPHLAATATGPARGGAEFTSSSAGEITPAQFAAMSYQQRTDLYQSDPDAYRRLAGA